MRDKATSQTGIKRAAIIAACTCLCVAAGAGLYQMTRTIPPLLPALEFSGAVPVSALFVTATGGAELPAQQNGEAGTVTYVLPEDVQGDGYKILATVMPTPDRPVDIDVTVNRRTGTLAVLAAGLSPENRISFFSGDTAFEKNIPYDWSGRIELIATLSQLSGSRFCIETTTIARPFLFCHTLIGGGAA